MKLLVPLAACLAAALAVPPRISLVNPRNTIFMDERLEGEIFEDVDVFSEDTSLLSGAELYRLPTTTKPLHYTVLWATDFSNVNALAFGGSVTIQLVATQANVNEIVIHGNDLNIVSYSLSLNGTSVPVTLEEETQYHFLRFRLQNGVLQNSTNEDVIYALTISFEALMREDMYGIYKSWFKTNGETKWMASTQFQATAARQAFPCYDEPSFKAYFDVTIRRPPTHTSWFCTTLAETRNSTGVTGALEDTYHTTPYMSTYLLALIVAEYESLPLSVDGVVKYEVIARPNAMEDGQGQYAFDVGQELLAEMSNHTGIDFYSVDPNIKMTQAAIPDFGAGAMENWGLLTYREAYIMYSEAHTSHYFKQLIAYILSHEIAHMWFGNLVTCEWWDTLWLNEGFARYYQYFLTHWVEGYMGLETRFITEQIHTALLSDAANSPHPLTNPGVGSPAAVSAMFSTLSYNKGAAVIRMTEHLLGFEVHREGLRNYLRQFQFNIVEPINLFESLQAAADANGTIEEYGPGFSVIDYYKSFTEQAGAPVLNVQVNHQTGDMTISQRRFNINTGFSSVSSNWLVPITFATASNPDFNNTKPSHIISEAVTVINRGSVGDEWVIFNKQQTGYYRVNYDDYTWDLIVMALRDPASRTTIHEYNRAQIVNDVFQFARSGLITYTRAFNILSFLENETSYAPWVAAITGFNWMRNRLAGTPTLERLESTIVNWAQTVMADIGYEPTSDDEDFMRAYLRWQLAPFMCNLGVPACLTAATTQFATLRANISEVDVNNRNFVYCNALRQGTAADFDFLWERFETHHVYTEKILLLQTLGCTKDRTSLFTFLNGIVQENELIRPQDYTTAWNTAVAGNEENTQLVFEFVQENSAAVRNAFSNITTPMSYISARLRSQEAINEFESWITNNAALIGDEYTVRAVISGAENSRVSIQWAASVSDDINNYVEAGSQPVAFSTTEATVSTEAVLVPQPNIPAPVAPELPDSPSSAASTFMSMFVILFAAAVTLMA